MDGLFYCKSALLYRFLLLTQVYIWAAVLHSRKTLPMQISAGFSSADQIATARAFFCEIYANKRGGGGEANTQPCWFGALCTMCMASRICTVRIYKIYVHVACCFKILAALKLNFIEFLKILYILNITFIEQ